MFAHLSGLLALIGLFLGNIIAPLIIWQIKKDDMPFAAREAKEALNFQINITIYAVICFLLCFVLIGFVLLPLLALYSLIFSILAAVKAGEGKAYRYPLTIRFVQ